MIKKERSMDNLRTCKPTMMDKGYGKVAKEVPEQKVQSKTTSNPDGTFTVTKSKGKNSASSNYKKEKDSNVYVNENGQKRTFDKIKK